MGGKKDLAIVVENNHNVSDTKLMQNKIKNIK
jgi:hypothetical protein